MRFKIKFRLEGKRQVLPLNYQYPLSSWIYKVLAKGDAALADMMHNEGYRLDNGKTFKLFTFSQLSFPARTYKIIPKTDRMELLSRQAWLIITFQLPQPAEKFVLGLFRNQKVELRDRISGIHMEAEAVEVMAEPEIVQPATIVRCLSPVVLAENKAGETHETYLSPLDARYSELFFRNLLDKYHLFSPEPDAFEQQWKEGELKFKCLTQNPKSRLQVIKAYTAEEVKVRGYVYEFEITAPGGLIQTGLNSGFGSMNAMGFGCGEVKTIHHATT